MLVTRYIIVVHGMGNQKPWETTSRIFVGLLAWRMPYGTRTRPSPRVAGAGNGLGVECRASSRPYHLGPQKPQLVAAAASERNVVVLPAEPVSGELRVNL